MYKDVVSVHYVTYLFQIPPGTKPTVIVSNINRTEFSEVLGFDEEFIFPVSNEGCSYY